MPTRETGYHFPPYVPEDNEYLTTPASTDSLALATTELGRLLSEPSAAFWALIRDNSQLTPFLDSYLQFARPVPGYSRLQSLSKRLWPQAVFQAHCFPASGPSHQQPGSFLVLEIEVELCEGLCN